MNNFLSFQVHSSGHAHKASDSIAGGLRELLIFLESLVGLSPAEIFSVILPGISGIANIHPLLVHFPIAFLFTFFVVDLTGSLLNKENWRRLAGGMLYLGSIMAGATVAAGFIAANSIEHGSNVHLIMEKHQWIGVSILCLSLILSLWRLLSGGLITGVSNLLFQLFAALLSVLIILGADLGSLMVYKYGVAVEAVEVTMDDYFHEHTHTH